MIEIKIECATGAEARQQLIDLLFNDVDPSMPLRENRIKDEKIAENFEGLKIETQEAQKPAEESTGKKRRTKAEIEAASKSAQKEAEKQAEGNIVDAKPEEEPKASTITKEMLQAKAVELIRNGKKDQVTTTIKSFDADSISQPDKKPVKVEDYAALMDAFNKII